MKKINFYLIVLLMASSVRVDAQVNYLFSASTKNYVPVSGGTIPHLKTSTTAWEAEDEGYDNIPIGFTFKYNNENYTRTNVNVNGFIALGGTSLDIILSGGGVYHGFPYFRNNLARGVIFNKNPVIAPFWDDLVLPDTAHLVYKTTGTAPNRIFTIEWKQAKWVYESLGPVFSIELKLFETSNKIEFHYKDEGTLPDPRYAFASIGITSAWSNRDFISLQNTLANPTISLCVANDSLSVKPANNQVYRFVPAPVNIPKPLNVLLKYTHNKVSFKLQSSGVNSFEYAISQSFIPPASGTQTSSQNVTIGSLVPSTTYYLYARSKGCSSTYSQWTCESFKTAVNPVSLPYNEDFETVTDPYFFPDNFRQQDFNDTSYYFSSTTPAFAATPILENAGNSMFNNYYTDYYDLNAWAFTPGFNLIAGKTYQFKFSYASFWSYDPSDAASLEVKYGKACGAAGMSSGTLFTKTDITNADALQDTIINFIPVSSGIYYFGFHDKSLFTKAALILDNISLEKTPACRLAKIENSVIDFSAMLFPNPVGDVTTLSLNLQHNAHVIIRIVDILGNEVLNICDNYFNEGNNSIVIETQYLTPGAYFCVMNVDGTIVSKQLFKN